MRKLPLYSIDQHDYLYFDLEEGEFYKALNSPMRKEGTEKSTLLTLSIVRAVFPIIIPIFIALTSLLSEYFPISRTLSVNSMLLALVTVVCVVWYFQYSKKLQAEQSMYLKQLDYEKVNCNQEERLDIILKAQNHYHKVLFLRVGFVVSTIILGILFLLSFNMLFLCLYTLLLWATEYLCMVTSIKSYPILLKTIERNHD